MDSSTVAAPAQSDQTELSAVHGAVAEDNFQEFQEARRAERAGQPKEPIAVEPEKKPAATEPKVSNRQQKINDYERRIAEQDAELARLRSAATPPTAQRSDVTPSASAAPARVDASKPDPEPDHTDAKKYPGGEYDPRYIKDAATWEIRQDLRKQAAEAQTRASAEQATRQLKEGADNIRKAFDARKAADPEFPARLDQGLMAKLRPAAALQPGEQFGPLNAIAEEMLSEPSTAPALAEYLSINPNEVIRLTSLTPRQLLRELGRLQGLLSNEPTTAAEPQTRTVTDAPDPAPMLGRKPAAAADPRTAAIVNDDFSKFQALKRAKLLAGRK